MYDSERFSFEEFMGCCAFGTIVDFPSKYSKGRAEELRKQVEKIRDGVYGGVGGVWCTLNERGSKQWHSTLMSLGFLCLSSGVYNPNTGNRINTYFLDFKTG